MKNYISRNPFFAILAAALLVAAAVAYAGPMNFGQNYGPQNGDETSVTLQKIVGALITSYGAPNVASGQVAAGSPATNIPARFARRSITVRNLDASLLVYVGADATVSATTGMLLAPGDRLPVDTSAAIYLFAPSGAPKVGFLETFTAPPPPSPSPTP